MLYAVINKGCEGMDAFRDGGIPGREDVIRITEGALQKLRLIARIMAGSEFRVIAVKKAGVTGCLIEDFVVPAGQDAEGHQVMTPGHSILDAYARLRDGGLVPAGLAHGHGMFPAFYSEQDHQAFDAQLDLLKSFFEQERCGIIAEKESFPLHKGLLIRQVFHEEREGYIALRIPGIPALSLDFPTDAYCLDDVLKVGRGVSLGRSRTRIEIASIVINDHGDLFAIKRYEETFPPFRLDEISRMDDYVDRALSDYPSFSWIRDATLRYSRKAHLMVVPSAEPLVVDERSLAEELGNKVKRRISPDPPAVFKREGEHVLGHVLKETAQECLDELLAYYSAASTQDDYVCLSSLAHGLDGLLNDESLPLSVRPQFEGLRIQYALRLHDLRDAAREDAGALAHRLSGLGCQSRDGCRDAAKEYERLGNLYLALGERQLAITAYHKSSALRAKACDGDGEEGNVSRA